MGARQIIAQLTAPIPIEESSFSRIWQHISQPGHDFAVISPFLANLSPEKNEERWVELKALVRAKQWGHTPFDSGYTYADGQEAREKSLLISGISQAEALALAQKYHQESILWKDDAGFVLLKADGTKLISFQQGALTFDAALLKQGFSALTRANKNQRGQFGFVPQVQESFAVRYLPELQGFTNYLRINVQREAEEEMAFAHINLTTGQMSLLEQALDAPGRMAASRHDAQLLDQLGLVEDYGHVPDRPSLIRRLAVTFRGKRFIDYAKGRHSPKPSP